MNVSGWKDITAAAMGDVHVVGRKRDGTCLITGWNPDDGLAADDGCIAWKNAAEADPPKGSSKKTDE